MRVIDFQPKGKDTLSKIVRGELTADEVRGIVDPNYKLTPMPSVEKNTSNPTEARKAASS